MIHLTKIMHPSDFSDNSHLSLYYAHEIVTYAKTECIDMIVMGTHGYTGLSHIIMGSVAENVVRIAPCPVLTVRPEEFGFTMP